MRRHSARSTSGPRADCGLISPVIPVTVNSPTTCCRKPSTASCAPPPPTTMRHTGAILCIALPRTWRAMSTAAVWRARPPYRPATTSSMFPPAMTPARRSVRPTSRGPCRASSRANAPCCGWLMPRALRTARSRMSLGLRPTSLKPMLFRARRKLAELLGRAPRGGKP